MKARVAAAVLALAVLLPAGAASAPSRSQLFFREKLLEDPRTSREVRALLRDGGGFVDRSIAFRDVTGDERADAVVRVQSGGSAGAVAFYVFSTHGARAASELRAVHRRQALTRAFTRVRAGVLSFRTAIYDPGDELCCPAREIETVLRWDERRDRFAVASRREIPREPAPAGSAPPQD